MLRYLSEDIPHAACNDGPFFNQRPMVFGPIKKEAYMKFPIKTPSLCAITATAALLASIASTEALAAPPPPSTPHTGDVHCNINNSQTAISASSYVDNYYMNFFSFYDRYNDGDDWGKDFWIAGVKQECLLKARIICNTSFVEGPAGRIDIFSSYGIPFTPPKVTVSGNLFPNPVTYNCDHGNSGGNGGLSATKSLKPKTVTPADNGNLFNF